MPEEVRSKIFCGKFMTGAAFPADRAPRSNRYRARDADAEPSDETLERLARERRELEARLAAVRAQVAALKS
jgi:hypothetical protein